uniref:Putative conserved secreted protein n=1 Tax=Ixodes ricinus TaxID=34613 RepID=A0A131XQ45_IXORI
MDCWLFNGRVHGSSWLLLLLLCVAASAGAVFHERVSGTVGGGNYSYYTLSKPGSVTILLHPVSGDPDLYVAERNVQPTFDLDNHCLQSTTCGAERLELPRHFKRPVGIGIYGHPSHAMSTYELEVRVEDSAENLLFFDYNYMAEKQEPRGEDPPEPSREDSGSQLPDESLLWTVLVGLLKLLLQVLEG